MAFNQSQIQAIEHDSGPMMVLAGPGSGKTLVITHRTRHLIESCGVNPSNILVITFTKAAAREMQSRFEKLMDGVPAPVTFGTFHSVFFRILKFAYRFDASNILREEVRMQYLRELTEQTKLEIEDEGDFLSSISSEISLVKGERISLEHYYSKNCPEEVFQFIYEGYERKLRNANLIDFDDMLVMCYELFDQRKDILAAWQNKFQYILIDEFQDINRVQYDIVKMLAAPRNNLFIVGDDDQSIYRFRGAKPEIMLGFEKDYPQAKRVLLNVNYRCSDRIVEASQNLIRCNKTRYDKEILAQNTGGRPVLSRHFKDCRQENEQVVKEIRCYVEAGCGYGDIAVLYRTNTGPRLLIEKLMEYNIPFRMRDSIPNLFDHWISQNIFTYIRVAKGSRARADFLQIINRPKRYVNREALEDPEISFSRLKQFYREKNWMVERLEQLEFDLNMIKTMAPYAAVNFIRKAVGYEEYLKEYASFRRMKPEDLLEVLDELQESAAGYQTFEEWFCHVEQYTEELREQARSRNMAKDAVSLSTMHSSKGLEYRTVFIIDANEGVTPHHKAVLDADIEEERRLFYVAMTRAKENLHIYSVAERYNKQLDVSRFVGEYRLNGQDLREGAAVNHVKYGPGVIRRIAGTKMIVYFERYRKEAVLDIAYCTAKQLISTL